MITRPRVTGEVDQVRRDLQTAEEQRRGDRIAKIDLWITVGIAAAIVYVILKTLGVL